MQISTILELLKLGLTIYQDERGSSKDRLIKRLNKLEKDYYEEMSRPDNQRSDLFIDNLMLEFDQLAREITNKK